MYLVLGPTRLWGFEEGYQFKVSVLHIIMGVSIYRVKEPEGVPKYWAYVMQIPINLNDATMGHKLQGLSKDIVIITSWSSGGIFTNWEYVVLSQPQERSRTGNNSKIL